MLLTTTCFSPISHHQCSKSNRIGHNIFRNKKVLPRIIYAFGNSSDKDTILGPEGLSSADLPAWSDCRDKLVGLGMCEDVAERTLLRGFGWGSQAYWRQELVRASPSVEAVESILRFLESRVGLEKDSEKAEVIQKFPELLQIDQNLMEENVAKLEKNFFLKGKSLAMSLKRKPKVLGATTDCAGDCAGDCTRCFAQF